MVNGILSAMMTISVFARQSQLSVDTVRLYVRMGLLRPESGAKGGSRPYQMFSAIDLEKARVIRVGRKFGLSLKEIDIFLKNRTFDGADDNIVVSFLEQQRLSICSRMRELQSLIDFIDAKIGWIKTPEAFEAPSFPEAHVRRKSRTTA